MSLQLRVGLRLRTARRAETPGAAPEAAEGGRGLHGGVVGPKGRAWAWAEQEAGVGAVQCLLTEPQGDRSRSLL